MQESISHCLKYVWICVLYIDSSHLTTVIGTGISVVCGIIIQYIITRPHCLVNAVPAVFRYHQQRAAHMITTSDFLWLPH